MTDVSAPGARAPGLLVVVSGPSGVGKSTLIGRLNEAHSFVFSVSATTRSPRPGETDGVEYHFVDRAEFESMISTGDLLEHAQYGTELYGTPAPPVLASLAEGRDVLLDIENNGAMQVKRAYPDAVAIFILPPSTEALHERLSQRGDTTGDDLRRRLDVADEQIRQARRDFDWLVVNEDIEQAVAEILRILAVSRRMRV